MRRWLVTKLGLLAVRLNIIPECQFYTDDDWEDRGGKRLYHVHDDILAIVLPAKRR